MKRRTVTTRILMALVLLTGVGVGAGAESETKIVQGHRWVNMVDGPDKVDQIKLAKVKAAFLVNFLKFTKWPDDVFDQEESPITVCMLGKGPVGEYLEKTIKTVKVHGRSVKLERMNIPLRISYDTTDLYESAIANFRSNVPQCRLIYVVKDETMSVGDLFNDNNLRSTLVVSDDAKILNLGGHLAFLIKNGHLAFTASVMNIEKTDMKVSSKLLRLAQPSK